MAVQQPAPPPPRALGRLEQPIRDALIEPIWHEGVLESQPRLPAHLLRQPLPIERSALNDVDTGAIFLPLRFGLPVPGFLLPVPLSVRGRIPSLRGSAPSLRGGSTLGLVPALAHCRAVGAVPLVIAGRAICQLRHAASIPRGSDTVGSSSRLTIGGSWRSAFAAPRPHSAAGVTPSGRASFGSRTQVLARPSGGRAQACGSALAVVEGGPVRAAALDRCP